MIDTLPDGNGYVHYFYKQFHAGYQVVDGQITLSVSRSGRVVSDVGTPVGGLEGIPTEVRVPESTAMNQVRRRAVSACALREPVTFLETPSSVLLIPKRLRRLVRQVTVDVTRPQWIHWTVQIDANTGVLLHEWGGIGIVGDQGGCTAAK